MADSPATDPTAPALVILAAGRSTRYGSPKPLVPVGPRGETLTEFTVYDALRAGFGKVIFVVHRDTGAEIEMQLRARLSGPVALVFALQENPPEVRVPGVRVRSKPWGTAAAILAAAPHLDGPFAVVNADDLYGADALSLAAHQLRVGDEEESGLVAYRLNETLSDGGGVSRAVCTLGRDERLVDIEEVLDIRQRGSEITGRSARGNELRTLRGDELVCMNLWAFQPKVMAHLEEAFPRYLATHDGDEQSEFLIGEAIGELVRTDGLRVRVLSCADRWHGITFPSDRALLAAALEQLTKIGRYPSPVFSVSGGTREESEVNSSPGA